MRFDAWDEYIVRLRPFPYPVLVLFSVPVPEFSARDRDRFSVRDSDSVSGSDRDRDRKQLSRASAEGSLKPHVPGLAFRQHDVSESTSLDPEKPCQAMHGEYFRRRSPHTVGDWVLTRTLCL
jgi:hypothetical protein